MDEFGGNTYYREAVSESQVAVYLAKVMGWMCVGLLTTFVASLLTIVNPRLLYTIYTNNVLFYGIIIAELAVVLIMSAAVNKINAAAATVMFMVYAALTGLTMATVFVLFDLGSVLFVFLLTAGIFLTMALYGFITKKDMTKIGTLAVFGLLGIIIAGVVNIFLRSSMLDFVVSAVGVVIFIVLTAFDTQRIKGMYIQAMETGYSEDSEIVRKASIFGALTLYLDFINLFLKLLRILGRRRS